MKKLWLFILFFGCGLSYATVTYVKDADGTVQKQETVSPEELVSSLGALRQEEQNLIAENMTMQGYVDKWQLKIDVNGVRLAEIQSEIAQIDLVK